MKKKITAALLVTVVLLLVLTAVSCSDKESEITVLPAETKHISTVEELVGIRDNYLGKAYQNFTFVLDNDLDLGDIKNWTPIGDSAENAFCATLDGNGKTVRNINYHGWDGSYLPDVELLERNKPLENTTSFPSMGLFGYSDGASFKNLTVSGINFEYYSDIGYSCIAGLVGYAIGNNTFENITVDGRIDFTNLCKRINVYDDRGERQGPGYLCDSIIYVGGLVALNNGSSSYKNISSSVSFNNEYLRSYYLGRDIAEPEDLKRDDFTEGYVVGNGVSAPGFAPFQLFAGGVCGCMKSGEVKDCSYTGSANIYAKSVYFGGIAAAGYGLEMTDCTVKNVSLTSGSLIKSESGGIIGLADNCVLKKLSAEGSDFDVKQYGSSQSMNVGGIFGFGNNNSEISDNSVSSFNVVFAPNISALKSTAVGGVGGVLRDSVLETSACSDAEFKIVATGKTKYDVEETCATVVNTVNNNSVLSYDGSADPEINVTLGYQSWKLTTRYSIINTTSYVDEDGHHGIRLFRKDSTEKYIYAFAYETDGGIQVKIYDEEMTLLSEAEYKGDFAPTDNLAESYRDVFFDEGTGFKEADSGKLEANGRDLSEYEYRSGKPTITEL